MRYPSKFLLSILGMLLNSHDDGEDDLTEEENKKLSDSQKELIRELKDAIYSGESMKMNGRRMSKADMIQMIKWIKEGRVQ